MKHSKRGFAWRRLLVVVASTIAACYLAIVLGLYAFQNKLIFAGNPTILRDPTSIGLAFEEVKLPVDGETTVGWYLPVKDARGTALFSHGNGGNIGGWMRGAPFYQDLGLNVLVYDPGGYGKSTGSASETRCYHDIRAMWHWLTVDKQIPANKIILVGRSLGGGITIDLATEVTPAGVALECTFASLPAQASKMYPWLPVRLLLRSQFDSLAKIPKIHVPILMFHSRDDELIPFSQAETLFAAANEPKKFFPLHGSHNQGFAESNEITAPAWKEFADEHLQASATP